MSSLCSVFAFVIAALFDVGEVLSASETMFKVLSAASVLYSLVMVIVNLGIFIECVRVLALKLDPCESLWFRILWSFTSFPSELMHFTV